MAARSKTWKRQKLECGNAGARNLAGLIRSQIKTSVDKSSCSLKFLVVNQYVHQTCLSLLLFTGTIHAIWDIWIAEDQWLNSITISLELQTRVAGRERMQCHLEEFRAKLWLRSTSSWYWPRVRKLGTTELVHYELVGQFIVWWFEILVAIQTGCCLRRRFRRDEESARGSDHAWFARPCAIDRAVSNCLA